MVSFDNKSNSIFWEAICATGRECAEVVTTGFTGYRVAWKPVKYYCVVDDECCGRIVDFCIDC